ncbi:MAG: protein kinase [Anaerolineae bacterium]|nr:protein kinase [Anaerolineae bacterium]
MNDLSGQIIKGYELRQLIGRGGFGAVYRAYQPTVDREVAIKIILPEYANHPNFIRRFETEAQIVARLEHIHIVPLYDYWREPDSACLVMRWLKGGSLQDSIDQRGYWELPAIARLLDQIAGALTIAHRNGIIHRDLKPANILLDDEGNAYLADFGIAKNLVTAPEAPTEDDRFGSPAYISPEQVTGGTVSPQTDIYSLGVVLYMLLTGRTPFFDPSTTTVIRRQLTESLPPLQSTRPELPHALNIIIWRATSKRPESRYPDALSLAADFRQVISPDATPTELTARLAVPTPRNIGVSPGGQTLIIEIPLEPENPYKGLRAFQEADSHDFFGRKMLIDRLIARMAETTPNARFLAVVGPSGSGKSSAVRAGLVPAIRRGALYESQDWYIVQMIPGSKPLAELADAINRVAINSLRDPVNALRANEHALIDITAQVLPEQESELVLVIDQFEEIFTLVSDETERTHFLKLILNAISNPQSRLRVIITLRADLYDRPLLYEGFGNLIRERTEIVLPLNSSEMEQAIVGPVDRIGIRFEPGLVADIIAEVNQQPGALPLLQYALTELFERREGYILTRTAYQSSGGVLGALARRADELYNELDSFSQAAAQQMFLRLVTLGEGVEDTRRRASRMELNAIARDKHIVQEVIDKFGKHRLLTLDYEPGTRAPTVEVAHEALIRVWTRLRSWLDTNRDELRLHRRLIAASNEWLNAKRDPSFLASGSRLAQFETLAIAPTIALNEDEATYLWASVAAKQRAAARLRWFIAGLAAFSLVALGLAVFAFDRQSAAVSEQQRADQQAQISRSRELAVTALTGVTRTDLALLLSLESLNAADTFEARNSLLTTLQSRPRLVAYLNAHTDGVRSIIYSPDGRLLASAGRDNQIILWDTVTNQPIENPLIGHTDRVNSIAISPNSQLLASASDDSTVRLWDTNTGQQIGEAFAEHTDSVWSVAFSPDGKQIASGSADGVILLWNPTDRSLIGKPLLGHDGLVYALAFSQERQLLASGGEDNTVRLWDTQTNEAIGNPLTGHTDWVLSIAFNPNGTILASTGVDESVIFWNTESGERLSVLETGHRDYVRSIAFSPDGKFFATGSFDQTIRLWDAQTGEQVGTALSAHQGAVWGVAFSPDSHRLASASADGSVILWNPESSQTLSTTLPAQTNAVLSVAYSPDGTRFATAGGNISGNNSDNSIYLWDVNGHPSATLSGHTRYITSLAFNPDGTILASASADSTIQLWDMATNQNIRTLRLPNRSDFVPIAFSPDGKLLVSGATDGSIQFWDMATGQLIGNPLIAHADSILSLAFSSTGVLASGSFDQTIILWDTSTQQPVGDPLTGHTDAVSSLAFSPNGQTLASGSRDTRLQLWDVNEQKPIGQPMIGHRDRISSIAFSPDGQIIASGSEDNTIILWEVTQREPLGRPFGGHLDWVLSLAFAPDGKTLVSGGLDRRIILWDVSLDSWKNRACQIANRSFTTIEWERYFRDLPYRQTCSN